MTDLDIYLQWGVAAAVTLWLIWRKQLTLFHPTAVYLAFHVIVFCLRPTFVHFYDFDFVWHYMKLGPKSADMELALWLSSAGLVVFAIAFAVVAAKAPPLAFEPKPAPSRHARRAFFWTALVFAPAGLASILLAKPSGETIDGVYIMTGTSGYLNDLQNVLIPVCILLVLMARWRWWSYLPFAGYLVFRMSQGWGRWTFVLSCFLFVLAWLWDHGRKFPPLRFLLPAPFVLVLFLNMSHDRMFFRNWLEGRESANVARANAARDWRAKWDTLDFANYDFLTYIVTYVPRRTKTYTYGAQYLQLFTEPIPRALWKNKPIGQPVKLFDLNDYGDFNGLTPSLVGDGWMSGGWFGALLTMGLVGGGLGFAFRWFARNQDVVHKACAFLIINAMVVQLFRDGGISIFKFLLFALAPLFVWAFLVRRFEIDAAVLAEREALREARFARIGGGSAGDDEAQEEEEEASGENDDENGDAPDADAEDWTDEDEAGETDAADEPPGRRGARPDDEA